MRADHLLPMFAAVPRSILHRVRARPAARQVQFTPPAVRGGNILYFWQWAYLEQARGRRASVLATEHMEDWLAEFPALQRLTVERSRVRPLDARVFATRHHVGQSFTLEQNAEFCRWLLRESPSFSRHLDSAQSQLDERTCVVNVRRGDYYSNPEFHRQFAIDIVAHVRSAIEALTEAGRSSEDILVVSDDPAWCREHLPLPSPPRFLEHRSCLFDDLAALAASRTLVLANSTFSYWGSHLARSLDDRHLAVAPPYHQRAPDGRLIDDLFDPRWIRTPVQGRT